MIFFLVKKLPKYLTILLVFISIVLLCFILAGSFDTSPSFSNVYVLEFKFNSSSEYYPIIQKSYSLQNSSSTLSNMKIRVGYLGMCVLLNGSLTCSSNGNLGTLSSYSGVSLSNLTNPDSQLNLVNLASTFANICHPYILMATIILSIILFFLVFWASFPLPGKVLVQKCNCIISITNVLLWGLGSMLQQEATTAVKKIVGPASMHTIIATVGTRCMAMTWTVFTFNLIVSMGTVFVFVRGLKQAAQIIEPKF